MRVLLHDALSGVFHRSGIGQALRQQKEALDRVGGTRVQSLDQRPDVVQLNFATPASRSLAVRARRRGIPVLYYAHSTEEDSRGSLPLSDLLAPLYRRWLTACYETADLVLTPTPYSKRLLQGYGLRAPIEVLSNGVDTDHFCPDEAAGLDFRRRYGIDPRTTMVVCVGHYFRRKGIVDMVDAARRHPDIEFWWFGHTDTHLVQSDVRAALAHRPSNFRLAGYVDRATIRDAYRAADAFCLASTEETEGIVVLEALAAGTPVLARDIPVYEGWLHDGVSAHLFRDASGLSRLLGAVRAGVLTDTTRAGREVAWERDLTAVAHRLPALWEQTVAYATARGRSGS